MRVGKAESSLASGTTTATSAPNDLARPRHRKDSRWSSRANVPRTWDKDWEGQGEEEEALGV